MHDERVSNCGKWFFAATHESGELVIALAIPALVRLFPNRSSIVALGIIGGMFSPVGWLIGESAVPPIALLIAQVLAWAGIAWLWREGAQRLEGLEL